MKTNSVVVVLGASANPERYAFRAWQKLREHGYRVVPVNPALDQLAGEPCYAQIAEVPQPIHTITMYLSAARSTPLIEEIVAAKPARIIFNPGAENGDLAARAAAEGIEVVQGCTLVMLQTGMF